MGLLKFGEKCHRSKIADFKVWCQNSKKYTEKKRISHKFETVD